MKVGVLLGTVLVLATTFVSGQTATGVHLVDVRFTGDTNLEGVDLRKCSADLKSRTYEGPEWLATVAERARFLCLQDNGYFKGVLRPSTDQLPDKHDAHQFVVTLHFDSGLLYRAGIISFRNNHVFFAG